MRESSSGATCARNAYELWFEKLTLPIADGLDWRARLTIAACARWTCSRRPMTSEKCLSALRSWAITADVLVGKQKSGPGGLHLVS